MIIQLNAVYSLEKTAEAMRYAGEGHAKGKVVIVAGGRQEVNYGHLQDFTFVD